MRIGEFADAESVSAQTIRFYERKGLLPPPLRGPNGYREYDGSTLNQLRLIRGAQSAGLSLVEIASILDLRGEGAVPCEPEVRKRGRIPHHTRYSVVFGSRR